MIPRKVPFALPLTMLLPRRTIALLFAAVGVVAWREIALAAAVVAVKPVPEVAVKPPEEVTAPLRKLAPLAT